MAVREHLIDRKRGLRCSITIFRGDCPPCRVAALFHCLNNRLCRPAKHTAEVPVERQVGKRQCIVWITPQNLIGQMEGFTAVLAREAPDVPMGTHHALPLPELGGFLAARALDLGSDNPGRDGADNAAGDLVLNGKDVLKRTVVALGPDVMAARSVDKLRGDANAIAGFAHAAFKHVAHAEMPRWTSTAQRAASTALLNSINTPSP